MLHRNNLLFILLAVSGVIVNLIAFFEWDPSYITNDGVQYLSTATNWLNGKGFSTDALMYSPHFQGDFPGPQTVWPPGYPLALSIFGLAGIDLITAGLILNLIAHAFASVLIFLILRRMKVDTNYAIFCAILFYGMATPWSFARGLITEPLFTCLQFAAILFLPVPGRSKFGTWLMCGTLVAGCIYVRYSAVIYAASVGTGIFIFLLFHNRGEWKTLFFGCLKLACLTIIPVAAFLQLMYRTNELTGTVDRNAGTRVPEAVYSTIRQWGAHSADLIGFSAGGLYSHEVGVLLFLTTVALVSSLIIYAGVIYRRDDEQDHHSAHARYSRIAGFVVTSHGLLLFIYLSYCALTDSPLEILTRYLYQVYPGIYVLFCVLMYGLINREREKYAGTMPGLLKNSLTVVVALYVIAQVNEATSPQRFFAEGQAAHKMLTLPVTEDVTLKEYIQTCMDNTSTAASIWSTHGQHLHFNTGSPTVTLAEIYTSKAPDFQDIKDQIKNYNVKLMVFLDDDLNLNVEYKEHLEQIKKWLSDNGHSAVEMSNNVVNSHSTVDVFQIDQQCG